VRTVPSCGDPTLRSRLTALGMLLTVLATAALLAGAISHSREPATRVAPHAVEAAKHSPVGRHVCTKPPSPGDPDVYRVESPHDRAQATSRWVVDHQLDAAPLDVCGLLPPPETVLDDEPSTEDRDEYPPQRTFDGRAPPGTLS